MTLCGRDLGPALRRHSFGRVLQQSRRCHLGVETPTVEQDSRIDGDKCREGVIKYKIMYSVLQVYLTQLLFQLSCFYCPRSGVYRLLHHQTLSG